MSRPVAMSARSEDVSARRFPTHHLQDRQLACCFEAMTPPLLSAARSHVARHLTLPAPEVKGPNDPCPGTVRQRGSRRDPARQSSRTLARKPSPWQNTAPEPTSFHSRPERAFRRHHPPDARRNPSASRRCSVRGPDPSDTTGRLARAMIREVPTTGPDPGPPSSAASRAQRQLRYPCASRDDQPCRPHHRALRARSASRTRPYRYPDRRTFSPVSSGAHRIAPGPPHRAGRRDPGWVGTGIPPGPGRGVPQPAASPLTFVDDRS